MYRIAVIAILSCILAREGQSAEFTDTVIYRGLANPASEKRLDVITIQELAKGNLDQAKSAAKAFAAQKAAGAAFAWYTKKVTSDFYKSLAEVEAKATRLDPTKPSDREELMKIDDTVTALRKAVVEIENALHESADTLMVLFSIREMTTANSFALFWIKGLPKLRKELGRVARITGGKLKRETKIASVVEDFKDDGEKRLASVKWAWDTNKKIRGYIDAKDSAHKTEAKELRTWTREVLDALPPPKERNDLENAVYGAYKALDNTMDDYVR